MTIEISAVDPEDPASFDPYFAVYDAACTYGPQGEFNTVWQAEEVRVAMVDAGERTFRLGWTGRVGDRVVATGWLGGSTVDNLEMAEALVCCAPAERGHGYAAEMLAHVEDQARALGRSRLVAEVTWPYPAGAEGEGSAELAWCRRQGFELGLVDVQRRLALPVDAALLDELAAEAAAHHQGYELRSFVGPVPDDIVEAWAALSATLNVEAPMGDIEREAESADVAGLRAAEAVVAKQGRRKVNTAAFAPDGELVAYTDIALTVHESGRAYQWGTLVRPDHRGHRLGLAVKVANLRLLQETEPQVTTVVTYNAEVNAPMVAVNERLGFRPVQWMGELQKRL